MDDGTAHPHTRAPMSKKNTKASHGHHAAPPTAAHTKPPASAPASAVGAAQRPSPAANANSDVPRSAAASAPLPPAPDFQQTGRSAHPGMSPSTPGLQKAPRRPRRLKVVGIVLGAAFTLIAVAYVAGTLVFTGRFLPNTTVGERDISLMAASDVERVLVDELDDYEVAVSGQGFSLRLTAEDAGMTLDAPRVVKRMLSDASPWLWPLEIVRERDEGKAVLLLSLELDEVMNLSDRILVMYEGRIVGEFDPAATTVQELGLYMAGAKRQDGRAAK